MNARAAEKKFKKTLDKLYSLCYNSYSKEREEDNYEIITKMSKLWH